MRNDAKRGQRLITALGAILGLWLVVQMPAAASTEPDDFVVENASDLVDLCSTSPDNELYVQAIHMCHGFVSGVAQYALILFGESGAAFFCLPDPPPSRNAAIADFVVWMGEHPEFAQVSGPEALVRYMTAKFPCS